MNSRGLVKRAIHFAIGRIKPPIPPQAGQKLRRRGGIHIPAFPGLGIETCKQIRRDPQVALGLAAIKAPAVGLKWWIECEEENIARFVESQLRPLWRKLALHAMNALDFGFQAFEKVWDLRGGAVVLAKMKDVNPSEVSMRADADGNFAGFDAGEVHIPVEKAFVFTYGKEWGQIYGRSRLDPIAEVWWWSKNIYKLVNRYFERKADPPIKARAPKGSRTDSDGNVRDNLELAEELAEGLKSAGIATFPAEYDDHGNPAWDFQYLLDDKRSDMFLSYIEHLDAKKLRGLFVPERALTQDAAVGSYSMAQTHANIFLQTEQILIDDYLDHLNSYLIPQIVEYNFGPSAPRAAIASRGLEDDSKQVFAGLVDSLFKTEQGSQMIRSIVDAAKLLEGLGVPIREQG